MKMNRTLHRSMAMVRVMTQRSRPTMCSRRNGMAQRRVSLALTAVIACSTLVSIGSPAAAATGIVFDGTPGTGAPPSTLGPYAMTPFGLDGQPFELVDGVTDPAGQVNFSPSLNHTRVGQGWATWSHGYTGDVYYGESDLTLSFPNGASAFYFYAEPNPFAVYEITAVAQDGTSSGPISVNGAAGAQYFGFYSQAPGGIASINVTSATDFAVGEFGIAGAFREIDYVALGDSYSSGEGTFTYDTHSEAQKCHRGPLAWTRLVEQHVEVIPRIEHKACTGAKALDLLNVYKDNAPQVVASSPNDGVELVTVTIGGNDVGFGGILRDCYLSTCADDPNSKGFNTKLKNLTSFLTSTLYPAIESAYPEARIVHVGYPRLTPKPGVTPYKCGWLEPDEQEAGVLLADKLNGAIKSAADARARVGYLDVTDVLDGHELCTVDSWMTPVRPFGGSERGHPNAQGQFALSVEVATELGFIYEQ